jgi:hypothetical protein
MVFSGNVIQSGALNDFFALLPVCKSRADVISFGEIALTEFLYRRGFRWDSYVPYRSLLKNPSCSPCTLIGRYKCPLIKIKALLGESYEPVENILNAVRKVNPIIYDALPQILADWEKAPLSGEV